LPICLILNLPKIPNETSTVILGKTPKPMKLNLVCECVKSNATLSGELQLG
jgi:hypothetical protein